MGIHRFLLWRSACYRAMKKPVSIPTCFLWGKALFAILLFIFIFC